MVGVGVRLGVGGRVGVAVRVGARVGLGVRVGVGLGVAVDVNLGVGVGLGVGVLVGRGVGVGARVGVWLGAGVGVAIKAAMTAVVCPRALDSSTRATISLMSFSWSMYCSVNRATVVSISGSSSVASLARACASSLLWAKASATRRR